MSTLDDFLHNLPPTASRPLLGQTVLAVEDSRFACEAVRLMCQRSGARIRRADCMASARRHLRVYRPSVVLIDLGLPDGSGLELIEELRNRRSHHPVILATSGDAGNEVPAMRAGAVDFLAKPLASLAYFQSKILQHLPTDQRPNVPRAVEEVAINPDQLAFQDDVDTALSALQGRKTDKVQTAYFAQFLQSVARSAADGELYDHATAVSRSPNRDGPLSDLMAVLRSRAATRAAV